MSNPAESELVEKGLPCPDQSTCGSSNAFAIYSDAHGYCFSGNHPEGTRTYSAQRLADLGYALALPTGEATLRSATAASAAPVNAELQRELDKAAFKALGQRKITLATCKRLGYKVRAKKSTGAIEELCPVHDMTGRLVAIKVRNRGVDGLDKDFYKIGDADISKLLIGLHLYGPAHKRNDGKATRIAIVEGEHDWMAVYEATDGKHPVCSLPQGVGSAVSAIRANLQTLLTYDMVILGFDQDDAGRKAMQECYDLFPPGKVWTAQWPAKDASDLKQADRSVDLTRALWNPRPYRPDGVLDARDLTESCLGDVAVGIPWPHRFMTEWTYGRRPEELYVFGSGTGMGKSDEIAEIIACTITGETKYGETFPPEACAVFNFEAGASTTKKLIAGKIGKRRFHIPNGTDEASAGFEWTKEELVQVLARMDGPVWEAGGKLFFNDSRGSADW
ncbi:MAG: toprim domain-containing protein, partial [Armatimonadaceae bacterium]